MKKLTIKLIKAINLDSRYSPLPFLAMFFALISAAQLIVGIVALVNSDNSASLELGIGSLSVGIFCAIPVVFVFIARKLTPLRD